MKKCIETRVDLQKLDDVCLDCCDYIESGHLMVRCENCAVPALKKEIREEEEEANNAKIKN